MLIFGKLTTFKVFMLNSNQVLIRYADASKKNFG